jgi:hypothetical protein
MSSQINSDNIDKTYPVAGQDNDSQGFRDNFDAIQANFIYTKAEIEDLQSKAVLKGALTGDTLDNDLGGSNISNGSYTNFHGTVQSAEVSTSTNVSILNGSLQAYTLADNTTFTFTNWPETGKYAKVKIHVNAKQNQVINVGSDVELGKKYTIYSVGTTNFVPMGASATAVFQASITGTTLSVSSVSSGVLTTDTYISGTGITPGTKITAVKSSLNPSLTGEGGAGTYLVNNSQSVTSRPLSGMTAGVTFIAVGSKGTGDGTIQPWFEANFATEGNGDVVTSSDFSLPLYLNPNGSHQVIEAWTYNGSASSPRVYMDFIGNLDATGTDFSNLNVAELAVNDITESASNTTGALTVAGGAGVAKNLNVGGSVVITGDLQVVGSTLFESNPTITIEDIGTIGNVSIAGPVTGDSLLYDAATETWGNNTNQEVLVVTVADNGSGAKDVIFLDGTALSTNASVQYGLKFEIGKKYKFDTHTSTNTGKFNYLRFSRTPDTVVQTTTDGQGNEVPGAFDTTITYEPANGSVTYGKYTSGPNLGKIIPAGTTGAYTEILVTEETPSPLYLYASKSTLNTSKLGAEYPIMVSTGPVKIISNYTIVGSQNVMVDVSSTVSGLTVTLPLLPNQGTYINITDNGNASATKPITIARGDNAVTINGATSDQIIQNAFGCLTLVSDGINWTAISSRYTGSEDVAASAAINLKTSVSYFSTSTGESASLAAGTDGQIKTLAMKSTSGDMVITVTNAGWKAGGGSGTITFNAAGDACTLQYVGSKWFVIGNNNCVFDEVAGGSPATLVSVPGALNSTGKAGQLAYNSTSFYVCTATDTWANVIFDNISGTTRAIFTGVPLSANSSGTTGQMASDSAYLYVCIASNTWKRIAWTVGW